MKLCVKICGLRSAEQVEAAVAAGADAIGFVFAESVRRITPSLAGSLSEAIPDRVKSVAVMRHPTDDELQAVLSEFQPDVVQTDVDDFASLNVPTSIEQWPVFREGNSQSACDATYIYEGRKSGHGELVDWSGAATIARHGKMILAGGLTADNVGEAIATVQPYGVDVSSGIESSPGQKDPQLIHQFLQAVRAAEKTS